MAIETITEPAAPTASTSGVKHGREQFWELQPRKLLAARHALEIIERQWDAALSRLKDFVEMP